MLLALKEHEHGRDKNNSRSHLLYLVTPAEAQELQPLPRDVHSQKEHVVKDPKSEANLRSQEKY
jgi:hypothetical protein